MPEGTSLIDEISKVGLSAWDAAPFLEKVTEIVPSIIYVFNQKTQSNEYSNRSLGSLMGFSPHEIQALGEALMPTLCHPDDLSRMAQYFEKLQTMQDGEVSQLEYRMKNKSGGWTWLLSYDTIFDRAPDGSVLRHIGVAADITAQKHAELSAQQERLSAQVANEELRSFAYSVSHDLKSPSNTLAMLLTELKREHAPALQGDAMYLVDLSLETVARSQKLIDDVLNYTQVIGQTVEKSRIPLAALLDDIQSDLRADITAKRAEIRYETLPYAEGSDAQIRILLQNLIENALKFHAPDDVPRISVTATTHPDAEMISISVADQGIGIPPQSHDRVFNLFERLHAHEEYRGTGLGLAICKRIAINHGGNIRLRSTPGKGATFTVDLPKASP